MSEEQLDLFQEKTYTLRNCPFCGGEAEYIYGGSIICRNTNGGCSAIVRFMLCSTDRHSIRLWNQREGDETPFRF